MKKTNTMAIVSTMALIMAVSLSTITFAREAESGSGSRGVSGNVSAQSAHVELGDDHGGLRAGASSNDSAEVHRSSGLHTEVGDDHGGLRASGSSDDSAGEVHRSAGLHTELGDDHGGVRVEVRLGDDNNNDRRGSELSGNADSNNGAVELRVRQENAGLMGGIQSQMTDLLKSIENLIEQLKKQMGL